MPIIPALERQGQADFWIWGQPGLQSEFLDSQGYTEKPCVKEKTKTKTKQNKTDLKWTCMNLCIVLAYPNFCNKKPFLSLLLLWCGLSHNGPCIGALALMTWWGSGGDYNELGHWGYYPWKQLREFSWEPPLVLIKVSSKVGSWCLFFWLPACEQSYK